jgi:hypothetical protein
VVFGVATPNKNSAILAAPSSESSENGGALCVEISIWAMTRCSEWNGPENFTRKIPCQNSPLRGELNPAANYFERLGRPGFGSPYKSA